LKGISRPKVVEIEETHRSVGYVFQRYDVGKGGEEAFGPAASIIERPPRQSPFSHPA